MARTKKQQKKHARRVTLRKSGILSPRDHARLAANKARRDELEKKRNGRPHFPIMNVRLPLSKFEMARAVLAGDSFLSPTVDPNALLGRKQVTEIKS